MDKFTREGVASSYFASPHFSQAEQDRQTPRDGKEARHLGILPEKSKESLARMWWAGFPKELICFLNQ